MPFLARRIVEGIQNIPRKGPLLLLCNHRSDCDVIFVQLACNRHISFMAKSDLFQIRVIGKFMAFWQAFAVHKGASDREALRHAIDLLIDQRLVCVFPEGQTSETSQLLPLQPGVALIASQSKAPVLCAGINGTERVLPYSKTRPQRSHQPVKISFGEIFYYSDFGSREAFMAHVQSELLRLSGEDTTSQSIDPVAP